MKTAHLELSDGGIVYVFHLDDAELFDDVSCGPIAEPFWPELLGEEPAWFERELGQLQDRWDDYLLSEGLKGMTPAPSYESDRREVMSW